MQVYILGINDGMLTTVKLSQNAFLEINDNYANDIFLSKAFLYLVHSIIRL